MILKIKGWGYIWRLNMNKYFKIKKILMLSLIIVLVFFIFRDLKELIAFYKFDINAPDLTADGRMLRNKFHASYYDPAILYSKIRQGANFNNIFLETNIFSFINGSFPKYLVLYIIGISTFIFFLTMLLLTITDYGYNYIHVILGYILLTYVVNDFFIMYISQNLSPLGSLFWLGGRARNVTTFISYIYMILIYLSLRFTKRKEF